MVGIVNKVWAVNLCSEFRMPKYPMCMSNYQSTFYWGRYIWKADRTGWKLTLQDTNATPIEPKRERGWISRRKLFLHYRGFVRTAQKQPNNIEGSHLTNRQTRSQGSVPLVPRSPLSRSRRREEYHHWEQGWTNLRKTGTKPCKNVQQMGSIYTSMEIMF